MGVTKQKERKTFTTFAEFEAAAKKLGYKVDHPYYGSQVTYAKKDGKRVGEWNKGGCGEGWLEKVVETEHPHIRFRYELEARVAKDPDDVEARQWLLALNGLIELAQKMGEQDDNLCYMNAWDVLEAVMLNSSKARK